MTSAITEKNKILRGNKQFFCAAILADLSKAFYCICYSLFAFKLHACGFHQAILKR